MKTQIIKDEQVIINYNGSIYRGFFSAIGKKQATFNGHGCHPSGIVISSSKFSTFNMKVSDMKLK